MRLLVSGRVPARRLCRTVLTRVVIGILGVAIPLRGASVQAQATPAHTRIITIADLTFEVISGSVLRVSSAPDTLIVGELAGIALSNSAATAIADPHATVVFSHTLRNTGNIADSFTLSVLSRSSWPVRIYRDVNGDGLLDAGDVLISAALALAAGASVPLLFSVEVPAGATTRGITDTLQLLVQSNAVPGVLASVTDQLQIRSAGILVTLTESVDRTIATPGDVLTYSVSYVATGPNSATNLRIIDPVPDGTTYLPGTLALNGHGLTDSAGDDAGTFDALTHRLVVTLASITGGDSGTITFQVRVTP